MSYTVLARRYRSTSFDKVVGQDAVSQTLRNAIDRGRVAHAYLFTGTRGVGKTSTARVFAKALNAPDDQPPDVALAIMEGRDTDVIEIDGASNNSVDQARELIANSVYRPLRGRYKVYIIDEVHMLTTQAFNALLKTMEEPPDHVVFILCTTEVHKVPATIQSRCQRFDFRAIPTALMAKHLAEVLDAEHVSAEPELVHAVARLGNGSMRDALSILDRLLAAAGAENADAAPASPAPKSSKNAAAPSPQLTLSLLERVLGLPERELVSAVISALANGDPGASIAAADALLSRGVSIELLVSTLAQRFRDMLVLSVCGEATPMVDASADTRSELAQHAQAFDPASLVHMIALCDSLGRSARSSVAPRAVLDAVIVRLALTERFADAAAIAAGAHTLAPAAPGAAAATPGGGRPPPKKT